MTCGCGLSGTAEAAKEGSQEAYADAARVAVVESGRRESNLRESQAPARPARQQTCQSFRRQQIVLLTGS